MIATEGGGVADVMTTGIDGGVTGLEASERKVREEEEKGMGSLPRSVKTSLLSSQPGNVLLW